MKFTVMRYFCATKTLAFFCCCCLFFAYAKISSPDISSPDIVHIITSDDMMIWSSYHHNPLSPPHSEGNADTVPSLHRANHSITDLDGNGADIGLSGGHA